MVNTFENHHINMLLVSEVKMAWGGVMERRIKMARGEYTDILSIRVYVSNLVHVLCYLQIS